MIFTTTGILILLSVLTVLVIVLSIFKVSFKIILKLVINSLVGGIILYLINFIPSISLPITWYNALAVGVFGIPAVIIILIVYFIKK